VFVLSIESSLKSQGCLLNLIIRLKFVNNNNNNIADSVYGAILMT